MMKMKGVRYIHRESIFGCTTIGYPRVEEEWLSRSVTEANIGLARISSMMPHLLFFGLIMLQVDGTEPLNFVAHFCQILLVCYNLYSGSMCIKAVDFILERVGLLDQVLLKYLAFSCINDPLN